MSFGLPPFRTAAMRRFAWTALGLACVLVMSLSVARDRTGLPGQSGSQTPLGDAALKQAVRPREVPPPPPEEAEEPGESLKDYLYSTGQAIQFYTRRVAKNPQDYISYRVLGELYYRRAAGEGGGLDDFARAEAAFRKSLAINAKYIAAQAALAGVLCQRHQFAEALELAREVRKVKPRNHEAMAITADALIEMGRYDEGEQALTELARLVQTAPVLARQANLAELRGKLDEAERLTREAIAKIRTAGGKPADLAWYQGRLGDMASAAGRLDEAEAHYRAVPEGTDAFHDATAGRARIAALRGRLGEAVALYEKAIAIGPDPHMLAAVGDLYLATGRKDRAESSFAQLLNVTDGRPEYLRERARFLADHDRDLPAALALAEADFAGRQDVHGHDVLAWALFKNGRAEESAPHSAAALKLGTRDPVLYYHAALIHDRLGNRVKAREELRRALAIQPRFSVLHAEAARKRLAELEQAVR
jgi:tetratricopeptide (TPR) repeat protein